MDDDDDKKPDEKQELFKLEGVEIFATGVHNGIKFDKRDLQDMIAAAKKIDFSPVIKQGHGFFEDGLPALGYIDNLRIKGRKLVADFIDMPKVVYDAIRTRRFDRVSAEIFFNFKRGGELYRRVLKAVALLGVEIPAVANLKPLNKLFSYNSESTDTVVYAFQVNMEDQNVGDETNDIDVSQVMARLSELEKSNQALKAEIEKRDEKISLFSRQLNETARRNAEMEVERKLEHFSLPAIRDHLKALLLFSRENVTEVQFAENGKEETVSVGTVIEKMMGQLDKMGRSLFSTQSKSTDEPGNYDDPSEEVDAQVLKYCAEHKLSPTRDYARAMEAVFELDPELKERYASVQN